ncbi:hypothetical protein PC123_g12873 [Phytophthora cactorum]|nr:hypothetical protein PC120_g20753 [Phytophthora cactorum]KAG4051946.1 hypothetical protein PC123_g12873 [Phytophthora cactorum]
MDDQELADRLTLLRITATADLEEISVREIALRLGRRDRHSNRNIGRAQHLWLPPRRLRERFKLLQPNRRRDLRRLAAPTAPTPKAICVNLFWLPLKGTGLRLGTTQAERIGSRRTDSRRTAPMLIKAIMKLATDVMVHTISPDAHTVAHASTTT